MPPEEILKKEGLETDCDWKAKGQTGLPALARKLNNLGYPRNKACPVNSIPKDRRIIDGKKETLSLIHI